MKYKKGAFFVGGIIGNIIDILFFALFFLMLFIIIMNFDIICIFKNLFGFDSLTMKNCVSCAIK